MKKQNRQATTTTGNGTGKPEGAIGQKDGRKREGVRLNKAGRNLWLWFFPFVHYTEDKAG